MVHPCLSCFLSSFDCSSTSSQRAVTFNSPPKNQHVIFFMVVSKVIVPPVIHFGVPPFSAPPSGYSTWNSPSTWPAAAPGGAHAPSSADMPRSWGYHGNVLGYVYIYQYSIYIYGWWLSPTPLKNDGRRQLGLWTSQYMEMFHTTNQYITCHDRKWSIL